MMLYDEISEPRILTNMLGPGTAILEGFARADESAILNALALILRRSPFRHMETPGGFRMSVAMTNCGTLGWISDHTGYRYDPVDPEHGKAWPATPDVFIGLAASAAETAGFPQFRPDTCLINRYEPGAKLSLHQDKNERDFSQPIVSISLGLPAVFLFGGLTRSVRPVRIVLRHGDVAVWGGPARLRYHGIAVLKDGSHPTLGSIRYNLSFRRAG